jgi:hypothetical protein
VNQPKVIDYFVCVFATPRIRVFLEDEWFQNIVTARNVEYISVNKLLAQYRKRYAHIDG